MSNVLKCSVCADTRDIIRPQSQFIGRNFVCTDCIETPGEVADALSLPIDDVYQAIGIERPRHFTDEQLAAFNHATVTSLGDALSMSDKFAVCRIANAKHVESEWIVVAGVVCRRDTTRRFYDDVADIVCAVDCGIRVYWKHEGYEVVRDSGLPKGLGSSQGLGYLIKCHMNSDVIGLTHQDGKTLNGDLFYSGG